ncbi:helix-turn-helix domain-containing protein [Blastococcus sp. BMG 814]|uniref:Helix-turn-helix domain-containing protein n=1 Tax=Blastococcus carthaginiensis TaxID=3050034 RepID=A0ABT9IDG1_9ACTN|nr:helix-turn-helix domain-containing protein [Blastococcus carthaginiensis]MDP5183619.1 helix-turn-helix domain-containing protein [Blastococcus carthaginiensis]
MTGQRTKRRGAARARSAGDAGLTRDAIVEGALELIEREGAGALTMRRLGAELQVDATAFYRHFRDKDDLVLACMDRAEHLAYEVVVPRIGSSSWQDVLRAIADETWTVASTYPAVYAEAFPRTTGGPGERKMVELLLSTVAGLGLDRGTTVLLYRAYADCLLSLSGARATMQRLGPDAVAKDASAWGRIYAVLPEAEYPAARMHAAELGAVTDREIFDRVVEALIATMEAAAAAAGRATDPDRRPPDGQPR